MKYAWLASMLLFLNLNTIAQVLPDGMSIKESEKFVISSGFDFSGFIAENEEGYIGYAYSSDLNSIMFMAFDKDLNQKSTGKLNLKSKHRNISLERIMVINDQIEVFYSDFDKDEDETFLKQISVSIEGFEAEEPQTFLKYDDEEINSRVNFRLIQSKNDKLLGIISTYKTGNDELQFLMHNDFMVYDEKLSLKWENTDSELTTEGEYGYTNTMFLGNDGTFLFTFYTFEINKETIANIMDYFKQYLIVLKEDQDPDVMPIEVEDKQIEQMEMALNDEGRLNLICFTYDKEEETYGYQFYGIDTATMKTVVENESEFGYPNGVVLDKTPLNNEYFTELRNSYSFSYSDMSFITNDLVNTPNGVTLIGQSKFDPYGYLKGKNYLGVLVAHFNNDGELEWETAIPKVQLTKKGVTYGSISIFEYDESVGIITNHLPSKDNNNNLGTGVYKGKKSTSTYAVLVDDGGDTRTMELLNIYAPFYQPKYYFENNAGSLVIFGNKGIDYGFLEIKIEK